MFSNRITRVIQLDSSVFREIAEDTNGLGQALTVVVLVALCTAFGQALATRQNFIGGFIGGLLSGFITWLLWSVLTYFVGTTLYQGRSSVAEMMRVLGFASAPQVLNLLRFIPILGGLAVLAGWLLSLIAGIIAIRESMEFDTTKALVTAGVALLIAIVINVVIFSVLFAASLGASLLFGS